MNDFYNSANLKDHLTPEEEKEWGKKLTSKNEKIKLEAINKFVECNIKLVIKIANQFSPRYCLDHQDLISEGVIGLRRAAERFDYTRNIRFSTFSSFWVKQTIRRALANKSRTVRLPVGLQQKLYNIKTYIETFENRFGNKPTKKTLMRRFSISENLAFEILNLGYSETSLNAPVGKLSEDSSEELQDIMADESKDTISEILHEDNKVTVEKYLKILTDREKEIIIHRFGLYNEERKTLEEISEKFDLTRERIRQLETFALNKLKDHFSKQKAFYANSGE